MGSFALKEPVDEAPKSTVIVLPSEREDKGLVVFPEISTPRTVLSNFFTLLKYSISEGFFEKSHQRRPQVCLATRR